MECHFIDNTTEDWKELMPICSKIRCIKNKALVIRYANATVFKLQYYQISLWKYVNKQAHSYIMYV